MDNNGIKKIIEWKILWKKTCGKTTAVMGRQWDFLLLPNIRGWYRLSGAGISGRKLLTMSGRDAACRAFEELGGEE
jgi:hypothetical protein